MKSIELFPHNEKGYTDLVNCLENSNFAFLERATGTGKSYILIKYMAEKLANKRVLFVTLHDSMFKQLTERDMPALGTSKDIYEKLDCILYSSINKHSPEWYYENYDCVIFDEAHHCAAPQWGKTIGAIRDLIRDSEDKKMIGATATGIRYLDNYLDVAKEFFDDNVASRLSITEAMFNEILPVPFYINNNYVSLENIQKIQKKLNKLETYSELNKIREIVKFYEEEAKKKTTTNLILKKYVVKKGEKYIVFCENIEDLKRKKEEADNWFKDIAPIEKYEAHSLSNNKYNQQQIDEFENNTNSETIKVMFAVDMFNEGLHIKGVDGIIMTRKTTSPIVYLQQLGRALSFSARNKQIKIFDLVGNATHIDIIYNLYKEFVMEAREKIENDKFNEGHYNKIVDRFKIVDEGNDVVEQLERIDRFLDENYLNKEIIKRYILILKNYISLSNDDFMTLLHDRKVDKEHLKIYYELRRLSDSLSFEDYVELNSLGIIISDYQQNEEILEKIKVKGSLRKVKESAIIDVIHKYNLYYLNNNRRPTEEDDFELVSRYRNYLSSFNKRDASKFLKNVAYKLNIEEMLLLKSFPSFDEINDYTQYVENKYKSGLILDELERKTVQSISQLVSLKNKPILYSLLNGNVGKIDESIKVLKEYLLTEPDERFENKDKFIGMPHIKDALDNLYKYAIYVTNLQFEVLLEMNIVLPEQINMSLEERKNALGPYESFYEKEESIKKSYSKMINEFIKEHGRRPNLNNSDEYVLALKYERLFKERNSIWVKYISKTLQECNIPLTIDEKIISGEDIKDNDLVLIYNSILEQFNNLSLETYNFNIMNKKIKILKDHNYIDNRLYKIWNKTNSLINYVISNISKYQKGVLNSFLYNNQAFVPFCLLKYIYLKLGMTLEKVESFSYGKENFVNVAYLKYVEEIEKVNEYIKYIKDNGVRPDEDSNLNRYLRHYLARASTSDIKRFCDKLNDLKIPLNLEETYLLKISTSDTKTKIYRKIREKSKSSSKLDALDSRIYKSLRSESLFREKNVEDYDDILFISINKELKNEIINDIKLKIKNNPNEKINLKNIYISNKAKEELEKYRIVCLSTGFITDLIDRMIKEQKPYRDLLNVDIEMIQTIIDCCMEANYNIELVDRLIKLDKEIFLKNNEINKELFLNEYLNFVMNNRRVPDINSEDSGEYILARKYEILKEVLSSEEVKLFYNTVKKTIEQSQVNEIYISIIDFIETNQRFPSMISDDKEETEICMKYQKIGNKLSLEQKKVIDNLIKKYQMNTILFIKSIRERNKGK